MGGTYTYLGKRGPQTGALDASGLNAGNWTVVFNPVLLNFTVPECFVYKITVTGAYGSSFDVNIENQTHDSNIYGTQNTFFDDSDTLIIRPGENLYLLYDDPATDGVPPVATIYLRYDYAKWGRQYGG